MTKHVPVLLKEVIQTLQPKKNQNFIDCTLGGGGHAEAILEKTAPNGKLIGLDLDPQAIGRSKERLQKFNNRYVLLKQNYKNLKPIFYETRLFDNCHGILLDLGLSSDQLADEERGFSFQSTGEVRMNFGDDYQALASDILKNYQEKDLIKIFKEYGEEKHAYRIVKKIMEWRQLTSEKGSKQKQKITAQTLTDLILQATNNQSYKKIHPATKIFQALRITVNDELNNLKKVLPQAIEILEPEGRLVIISFHSLEDRIVKEYFKKESKDCWCPPEVPVCRCGHYANLKIITKKAITPTPEETKKNPRSRSAKLRVAEKI